ncbi:MAG: hypothetical protein H6R00_4900 [Proteobacteria bacterium]|nr:hypothetical protein [Pseudomonadota bacterium]
MLTRSARFIRENLWFYFFLALVVIVMQTLRSLGALGQSTHAGVLVVCAYLSANVPLAILHGTSLTGAASFRGHGQLKAGLKVATIAAIIAGLTTYLFLRTVISKGPGGTMTNSDYFAFLGILVLALPAVITLLGSWVPAGLAQKDPGFVSAVGRGVMSVHTVYWRLVLSLTAYILVAIILGTAYVFAVGKAPFLTTGSGGLDVPGIAYWYIITLFGMMLLTYINVVVCMDYMRFEKIDPEGGALGANAGMITAPRVGRTSRHR